EFAESFKQRKRWFVIGGFIEQLRQAWERHRDQVESRSISYGDAAPFAKVRQDLRGGFRVGDYGTDISGDDMDALLDYIDKLEADAAQRSESRADVIEECEGALPPLRFNLADNRNPAISGYNRAIL